MPPLLDDAIAALRDVPADRQDEVALAVIALAGETRRIYRLTPDEIADLAEADAEIERGEVATEGEIAAIWAKHGL